MLHHDMCRSSSDPAAKYLIADVYRVFPSFREFIMSFGYSLVFIKKKEMRSKIFPVFGIIYHNKTVSNTEKSDYRRE